jgi:hypothetical protein
MPFINGLEVSDATGRAFIDLNAALPVPPAKAALGGMLYSGNRLQVDDSISPAPFTVQGGFLYNANGQLCILQSLPGGAPIYNNGVRINQLGAVAISAGGPIAGYVHGWPVTVDGALCIDAGGPVVTTVNWNPADKGTDITLTGSNLIATSGGAASAVVRANVSRSSGKFYFEVVRGAAGSTYPYIGIAPSSLPLTATTANAAPGVYAVMGNNFFCYANGANVNTGQTWANGDVEQVAVNFDTLKVWFGKNGTWFNGGNPAAGTGQIFTIPADVYFPMANCRIAAAVATARFAAASFQFTPPSGFQEWGLAPTLLNAFSDGFSGGFQRAA